MVLILYNYGSPVLLSCVLSVCILLGERKSHLINTSDTELAFHYASVSGIVQIIECSSVQYASGKLGSSPDETVL